MSLVADMAVDAEFFEKRPAAAALIELFEYLPGVIFYAKDRESRYVAANRAMLIAKELTHSDELLGKTDREFHPSALADAYTAEDQKVLRSGVSLPNQVWFIIDRSGRPGWFHSSKIPLRDEDGGLVGIAGVRYSIETPEDREQSFRALAPVIRFLEEYYTEVVSMKEMACMAGLSPTHFNREFSALLGVTPTRFLHCLRTEKARHLLARTERSLAEIAAETGYHDQSHFTRHFRKITGTTPAAYRKGLRESSR